MKAVVIDHAGGPDVLSIQERALPKAKAGWSVIHIKAFGLNHAESITRPGGSPSVQFPRVIGIEAVGEIYESSTPELTVGEKVMTLMGELGRQFDGSYEEYALVPNTQIYQLPIEADWAQLATIPESGYTAMGSIKIAKVQSGQTVLVRGATSNVGVAAVQLLKAMNTTVYASTRSEKSFDYLTAQGADEPILDQDGELQTAATFDAIIDFVGDQTLNDSLSHLKQGDGYMVVTGELADTWETDTFSAFNIPWGSYLTNFQSTDINQNWLDEMFSLINQAHLRFPVGQTFELADIVAAHHLLDAGHVQGKLIVTTP